MRDERGFTLLEVLVAMAVLALAILGSLQALLLSERLQARARSLTQALFLAQERVERIGALGWDRATAGLERRPVPELTGSAAAVPTEEIAAGAVRFLVLFERGSGGTGPPRCAVTCYWSAGARPFEPRNAVRLQSRSG